MLVQKSWVPWADTARGCRLRVLQNAAWFSARDISHAPCWQAGPSSLGFRRLRLSVTSMCSHTFTATHEGLHGYMKVH